METTSDCMPKEENGLSISNSAFYIYSSFYTINVKKNIIFTQKEYFQKTLKNTFNYMLKFHIRMCFV